MSDNAISWEITRLQWELDFMDTNDENREKKISDIIHKIEKEYIKDKANIYIVVIYAKALKYLSQCQISKEERKKQQIE